MDLDNKICKPMHSVGGGKLKALFSMAWDKVNETCLVSRVYTDLQNLYISTHGLTKHLCDRSKNNGLPLIFGIEILLKIIKVYFRTFWLNKTVLLWCVFTKIPLMIICGQAYYSSLINLNKCSCRLDSILQVCCDWHVLFSNINSSELLAVIHILIHSFDDGLQRERFLESSRNNLIFPTEFDALNCLPY